MTADKASWKLGGARLRDNDIHRAHWEWKLVRSIKTGYQEIAAFNGAFTHDNSYAYTVYNTNGTGDIVLAVSDGTTMGEELTIKLYTDGGNDVVVTPTNLKDGTTVTLDDTLDACTLFWDGTNWSLLPGYTGTLA